jgi:RNA polymerase sigma-70 factor (ECF subfamily)
LDGADLLAVFQAGGAGAAALLYDRYEGEVNQIVWHMLGADPDHDDIVHEVFLVVLGKLGQLQEPAKLGGWIRSVTVNAVRQELRKRKVRRLFKLERSGSATVPTWLYDEEGAQTMRFLFGILGKLTVEERILIALRHLQEYTLAETAAAVGCSLATVKRKLRRAKQSFRTMAQDEPGLVELARALRDEREER